MSKKLNERIDPIRKLAEACGVTIEVSPTNSQHIRVELSRDGVTKTIFLSGTASDHRAIMNSTGDAKRVMRQQGWMKDSK